MRFVLYVDRKGRHRWRLVASNGLTVADSGQGYSTYANCRRAVRRIVAKTGLRAEVEGGSSR